MTTQNESDQLGTTSQLPVDSEVTEGELIDSSPAEDGTTPVPLQEFHVVPVFSDCICVKLRYVPREAEVEQPDSSTQTQSS